MPEVLQQIRFLYPSRILTDAAFLLPENQL
jgi:hypothetical protein